eukprot:scaffold9354_cov108-Isochrysis_galbana.AAC.9
MWRAGEHGLATSCASRRSSKQHHCTAARTTHHRHKQALGRSKHSRRQKQALRRSKPQAQAAGRNAVGRRQQERYSRRQQENTTIAEEANKATPRRPASRVLPPAPVVVAAPRDKVRGRAYVACESGKQKRPRLGRRLKSKYIRHQELAVGLYTIHSSTGKVFDTH